MIKIKEIVATKARNNWNEQNSDNKSGQSSPFSVSKTYEDILMRDNKECQRTGLLIICGDF